MTLTPKVRPEIAFYYPNPMWDRPGWIKNLLLFFDGIGTLVPNYMKDRVFEWNKELTKPLYDKKLLHIFEPETFIDQTSVEQLAKAMADILASGALDPLATNDSTLGFAEISMSRMGYMAHRPIAERIHSELTKRGLARETQDGLSVPMHPMVRSLILVLWSQILRPRGRENGLELWPATDHPEVHIALGEILNLPKMPSAGHVASMDMGAVGVDLEKVPLDEVLDFKAENLKLYRRYSKNVREFVSDLAKLPAGAHTAAMRERRQEIKDEASDIKKAARTAWRLPLTLAGSLAGAVWRTVRGDPLGGLLAVGVSVGGASLVRPNVGVSAYSYLFMAKEDMDHRWHRRLLKGVRKPRPRATRR